MSKSLIDSFTDVLQKFKKTKSSEHIPLPYDLVEKMKIFLETLDTSNVTGWANYVDSQYTDGSPLVLTTAEGLINLPNNAGNTIESFLPIGMSSFYDGTKIIGLTGNAYVITMEYKVRPTSAAASPRILTSIDIGGAVGNIFQRDFTMGKGNGVIHNYLSAFLYFTLDTWEANGGTVKVQAIGSDVEIFDIRYLISLQHLNKQIS